MGKAISKTPRLICGEYFQASTSAEEVAIANEEIGEEDEEDGSPHTAVGEQQVRWTATLGGVEKMVGRSAKSIVPGKRALSLILPCLVDRTSASSQDRGTGFNPEWLTMSLILRHGCTIH